MTLATDAMVRCDRSDHDHASLDEARMCYTVETATPESHPFSCKCGARRYATKAEQGAAEPNGLFKCPNCHTFASDHNGYGDADSDFRCYDCDTRLGSHGVPPVKGFPPLT